MPELPEVEAARRAIEEHCIGKEIVKSIIIDDKKVIDGVSASDFEASLLGETILSAHRKGKNTWLHLDFLPFPSFQFGEVLYFGVTLWMAGATYIKGVAVTKYKRSVVKDTDEWPSKYSKLFVELDDGLELSFTDKRQFARVCLFENPTSESPKSELGPDALLESMAVEDFTVSLSKKKLAIKAVSLDQSYISGIYNWIADEVLYQARIHPQQIAASLSKESRATLLKCIKEVIEKAVQGKKIDFITTGGRTTAYVPELQKLNGVQAARVVSKSKKQASKTKDSEDDVDNGIDEQESDREETTGNVKLKKGGKFGGRATMPSNKRKSKESDDNDNGGSDDDDGGDDDTEKVRKTKTQKATKNKQAKTVKTKKENVFRQKSKPTKKKAK